MGCNVVIDSCACDWVCRTGSICG